MDDEHEIIAENPCCSIKEGAAEIIFPEGTGIGAFYNPVQEFNRDLTITVLRAFSEQKTVQKDEQMELDEAAENAKVRTNQKDVGLRILDALSASGLRAIRFALEVPNVELVVANDFSEQAFDSIKQNVRLNGVEGKVKPSFSDAIDLMMEHRKSEKRFHAVDLDPYGSASLFLDSAVQAVANGGILMVTCTDTAILCGNSPEACFNKYGSLPIRHKSCHEMALRILLRAIDSHANRHGRFIVPLLSVSVDFYIRCFVRIQTGAAAAKNSVTKLSQVLSCARCQSLDFVPLIRKIVNGKNAHFSAAHFQSTLINSGPQVQNENGTTTTTEQSRQCSSKCTHCGSTAIHFGGPIFTAPIHDAAFVQSILNSLNKTPVEQRLGTHERMLGVLTLISEELHDRPLFYEADQLMNVTKCQVPKLASIRSAILNAGFRCSGSHCNPKALKTDAPTEFLWDVCRAWAKKLDVNMEKLKLDAAGIYVLNKESTYAVNFAPHREAVPPSKAANILRFQDNKGKNWGPRTRAKASTGDVKR